MRTRENKAVSQPDGSGLGQQIVDRAREQFIARGFNTITMDDICAGLHISKKTLYTYFRSKEELFEFALDQTIAGIEAEFDGIIKNTRLGVLERISALMDLEKRGYSCLSRPLLEDIRRYAPAAWERITAAKSHNLKELAVIIDAGIREGLFRPEMDVEMGLNLYEELIRAALSPDFLIRNNYSAAAVNSAILHLFLRAMLTDKGRATARQKGLV